MCVCVSVCVSVSVSVSVCVSVCLCLCVCLCGPLVIQHAPYYIVTCGLSDSTIVFHIISKRHDFGKVIKQKSVF